MTALKIDQNVLDQAYAWIVALRGEQVGEKDLEEFSGWLTEDKSHQLAWDEFGDGNIGTTRLRQQPKWKV